MLTADESQRLIDALDEARLAAATPSEYLVRVARSIDDLNRWTAEHPSLRMSTSATNPADALVLAGAELGRVLNGPISGVRHRTAHVGRAVADAIARTANDPAVSGALTWALAELDTRTGELHELRYRQQLDERSTSGDQRARSELRAAAIDRLTAAGVTVAANGYDTNGFDDADRLGLHLPCLALAYGVSAGEMNGDVPLPRFAADRGWFALCRRVEPRPMSRYETAIISPLTINDETELALRRLSPRVPSGMSIGAFSAFRALMEVELPSIDVDHLRGPLSPVWVRLPLDALGSMISGTTDQGLDVDQLIEPNPDAMWPVSPRADLVWIADDADHDGW